MRYWPSSKIFVGGLLIVLLIVVIWFPLLFMSFINSAYIDNKPVEATFTLSVGGYQVCCHIGYNNRKRNYQIVGHFITRKTPKLDTFDNILHLSPFVIYFL